MLEEHRQALDVLRADDHVDGGRAREDGLAFLLGDAAGDGDDRAGSTFEPLLPDLAQTGEELFLRPLADAARVDNDDVGVRIIHGGLVAGLFKEAGHPLRVVDVHLAAVGFDEVFHWFRAQKRSVSLLLFIRLSPACAWWRAFPAHSP